MSDVPYPNSKNSWEIHVNMVKEVDAFLKEIGALARHNALHDYLHAIIWHDGIDPVRWIQTNMDLVKKIIKYNWISDVP